MSDCDSKAEVASMVCAATTSSSLVGATLRTPVFSVRDGDLAQARAVLGTYDDEVHLAAIERRQTPLHGLLRRRGLQFVEHRHAMARQKRIGDQQVLSDQPLVLEFLLHGTHEDSEVGTELSLEVRLAGPSEGGTPSARGRASHPGP
jgi:hypothetical protein